MKVYRNYYGASVDRGIGVQAQSPELNQLNLDGLLKELSSMHALESSEHDKEMLSYLVEKNGYTILGVSYTEQPKSSGYNRSAPCGLQYIVNTQELTEVSTELGSIVNFVSFQKPESNSPAPLNYIPRNESGYTFHNSPSIIAPIIDSMIRVAISPDTDILVVALPKGKNSEYATARYAIAELLCYLPAALRMNIRFFTGLPVPDGKTDPIEGLDNAIKFGANVIFCPNEYYRTLTSHRNCYGVDMDQPGAQYGSFAQYIANSPDISDGLATVLSNLNGPLTYDRLNSAAEQAQNSGRVSIEKLQSRLAATERECGRLGGELKKTRDDCLQLQQKNDEMRRYYENLKQRADQLNRDNQELILQNEKLNKTLVSRSARIQHNQYADYEVNREMPPFLKGLLFGLITIVMMAIAILVYNGFTRGFGHIFDFSQIKQETVATEPIPTLQEHQTEQINETAVPETSTPEPVPTDNPTEEPTDTSTPKPTDTYTPAPTNTPTATPIEEQHTEPDQKSTEAPVHIEYPSNSTKETTETKEIKAIVTDKNVRLRSEPVQKTETIIRKLNKNDSITILEQYTDEKGTVWYKVRYKEEIGYIMADYVQIIDDLSSPQS